VAELHFFIEGITPRAQTFTPALTMQLRIVNGAPEPVHALLLRCQVQIDAPRRRYGRGEQERLAPLFAEPERWDQTLRPLHWQIVTALVGGFIGTTITEVDLACSLDFGLAATQYLASAEQEPVPLRLFFSGTLFYRPPEPAAAAVQAAPIDWNLEAAYRMPAAAWREAITACCGATAWLPLQQDAFARLLRFRSVAGHSNWEQTIEALLPEAAAQRTEAA
jgi:hypothetical protein